MNPPDRTWCASASIRTDAERIPQYRKQAAQYRKFAADEVVPLARDCLLDMARHLEQLASELEASARYCGVDQLAKIEVH